MTSLSSRIWPLLTKPNATWSEVAAEGDTTRWLWRRYLPIMMAPSVLISLISTIDPRRPVLSTDIAVILLAPATFILFAIISLVIFRDLLLVAAPRYGVAPDRVAATKLAIYIGTPVWLGAFPGVIPGLGLAIFCLAVLYAIYLLRAGAPLLMPPSAGQERAFAEAAIVRLFVTALIVIPLAVLALLVIGIVVLAISTTHRALSGG